MATSLGGWFDKVFFDAHGEPCASGELRFYQTGTDIPQGVATFDGTPLGAVIRLDDDGRPESDFRFYTDKIYRVVVVDADGVVVKTIDGVAIPEGEGGGMYNPMTTAGDLIVGTTGGEPARLGVGTDGDILATGNGAPTWEGGPKKYRNVYQNLPSPQIDDGYLGCLFYLSGSAQALTLPATANVPSKSFIDFVFLDGTATLTITPQGTTTLNEQAAAVTIGGQAATLYRLTFLGHGGSGDEWALGGSGDGDHKTAVDGADASPDYLAAKLVAGSGISLTNTGSAVEISATAQTGDHQLLVSATDASAGYLGAKLTAGSNVTLTPQTDGDGVQTLEISATGSGGGGGDVAIESISPFWLGGTTDIGTGPYAFGVQLWPCQTHTFNRVRLLGGQLKNGTYAAAIYRNNDLLTYTPAEDRITISGQPSYVDIPVPQTTINNNEEIWVFFSGSGGYKARSRNSISTSPVIARSSFIYSWNWKAHVTDYTVAESYFPYVKLWKA